MVSSLRQSSGAACGADSRSLEVTVARSGAERMRVSDHRGKVAAAYQNVRDAAQLPSELLSSLHQSHQTTVSDGVALTVCT